MLNILLSSEYNGKSIYDIDTGFIKYMKGGLNKSKVNINLLKDIESAKYYSTTDFIDRFGCRFRVTELSTGCKGALLVANQDIPVNFLECRWNASDAVIRHCRTGSIILYDFNLVERRFDSNFELIDEKIDVLFRGKHFTSLDKFNDFLDTASW